MTNMRNQHGVRVSAARKRVWAAKLEKLVEATIKTEDDLLVSIAEAREDGLTNEDIAYMVRQGGRPMSSSGVGKKADQGEKVIAARKGKAA